MLYPFHSFIYFQFQLLECREARKELCYPRGCIGRSVYANAPHRLDILQEGEKSQALIVNRTILKCYSLCGAVQGQRNPLGVNRVGSLAPLAGDDVPTVNQFKVTVAGNHLIYLKFCHLAKQTPLIDVESPMNLELVPKFVLQKPTVIDEFTTEAGLSDTEGNIQTIFLQRQNLGHLRPVYGGGEGQADVFVKVEGL